MLIKVFEHEFHPNCCNYFHLNLLIPDFVVWQQEEDCYSVKSRNIRISFPNKFVFSIDSEMWVLEVQLLGFGLGMVRQWNY